MQRWRGVQATPAGWGRCVVTIGVFDGVHRGHRQIVGRAVERARTLGVPALVLTFDPHPSSVVRPGTHPPMLTSPRHKAELLEALGVDALCVLPFTAEFSRWTPEEFIHDVLVEPLHAAVVVIGENFRFGAKAAGTIGTLRELGGRWGFAADGVALLADSETTLSSTYVRSCVAAGDVVSAARALGREHRIEGVVVRGDRRGRTIGYPTANLAPLPHSAVPSDGVYAGRLVRGNERLPAAISIGTNPTFDGTERRIEAYVLPPAAGAPMPDLDLYGEHVGLDFTERLRGTERFDGVEPLLTQMRLDVERTRELSSRAPHGASRAVP